MEDNLARAATAILLIGGFVGGVAFIAARMRRRLQSNAERATEGVGLVPEVPTLLYFWTKECAQCPGQEREILKAVESIDKSGKKIAVRKINALEQKSFAHSMSVMTVPTTILFDNRGTVAAWNSGLTTARELITQLRVAV